MMTSTVEDVKKYEPTKLVIATRLHLGRASSPPSDDKLTEQVGNFYRFVLSVSNHNDDEDDDGTNYSVFPVIAVDATPKIDGYDYVQAVQAKIKQIEQQGEHQQEKNPKQVINIHVLPVTPWGKFVPALNALILYASEESIGGGVNAADLILFVSAEVTASPVAIKALCRHVMNDYEHTLVAGAAMNGHMYHASDNERSKSEVELSGRTCPWNTLAVWNVRKIKLTGFVLCSDLGQTAGVEECTAIALQQKLFTKDRALAKLVKLDEISWQQQFDHDNERQKWHEQKMKSKLERAATQLDVTELSGIVIHC